MCGLAGLIYREHKIDVTALQAMTSALAHRGPDGEGLWLNPKGQVGLGHRRLSIVDPSPAAGQPWLLENRYAIIHNGEIYNYQELRRQLQQQGHQFTTQSDTEVLLKAYVQYRTDCLQYLDGMFAFAIWDEYEQRLFAARDRFGEKPFYYIYDEGRQQLMLASEPKAFRAMGFPMRVNETALLAYLGLNQVSVAGDPSQTFYAGLLQLPPAHYLLYTPAMDSKGPQTYPYWKIKTTASPSRSYSSVLEEFQERFQHSVSQRLRSDVAIGTSLSGGIDSAAVVATLHQLPETQTASFHHQSFTAVFPGFEKDEQAGAARTAQQFGLKTHWTELNSALFSQQIVQIIRKHEEPVSSASVFAQYKVFEEARRQGIKVLLDGQGADELLGGYARFRPWFLQELWRKGDYRLFVKEKAAFNRQEAKINWSAKNIAAAWFPSAARLSLEQRARGALFQNPDLNPEFIRSAYRKEICTKPLIKDLNDLLRWTACQHGLNELLRYADRNSMSNGCEVRLPFLQHELAEWLLQLPATVKYKEGFGKWLLRKCLEPVLPADQVWQNRKIGFEPPQFQWMGHPAIQQQIMESKKILVDNHYLHQKLLKRPPAQYTAYERYPRDWMYLVAGVLIGPA